MGPAETPMPSSGSPRSFKGLAHASRNVRSLSLLCASGLYLLDERFSVVSHDEAVAGSERDAL